MAKTPTKNNEIKPTDKPSGMPVDGVTSNLNVRAGLLNDVSPGLNAGSNLLRTSEVDQQTLRNYVVNKGLEVDALTGIDYFKGIVLRVENGKNPSVRADPVSSLINEFLGLAKPEAETLRARVRVPEIHRMLPPVASAGDPRYPEVKNEFDDLIDLYPICEAVTNSPELSPQTVAVGDIVTIGFHNKNNIMHAPRIIAKERSGFANFLGEVLCGVSNSFSALTGQVDALQTAQVETNHTGDEQSIRDSKASSMIIGSSIFVRASDKLREELASRGYNISDGDIKPIDASLVEHIPNLLDTLRSPTAKESGHKVHTLVFQFDDIFSPDTEAPIDQASEREQCLRVLSAFLKEVNEVASPAQIILLGTTKKMMTNMTVAGNALIKDIIIDAPSDFVEAVTPDLYSKISFIDPLEHTFQTTVEDAEAVWASGDPLPAMLAIINEVKIETSASPPTQHKAPAPPPGEKKQPQMPAGYQVPNSLRKFLGENTFADKAAAIDFLKEVAISLGWDVSTDTAAVVTIANPLGGAAFTANNPHWTDLMTKDIEKEVLTRENVSIIMGLTESMDDKSYRAVVKALTYKIGVAKDIYEGKDPTLNEDGSSPPPPLEAALDAAVAPAPCGIDSPGSFAPGVSPLGDSGDSGLCPTQGNNAAKVVVPRLRKRGMAHLETSNLMVGAEIAVGKNNKKLFEIENWHQKVRDAGWKHISFKLNDSTISNSQKKFEPYHGPAFQLLDSVGIQKHGHGWIRARNPQEAKMEAEATAHFCKKYNIKLYSINAEVDWMGMGKHNRVFPYKNAKGQTEPANPRAQQNWTRGWYTDPIGCMVLYISHLKHLVPDLALAWNGYSIPLWVGCLKPHWPKIASLIDAYNPMIYPTSRKTLIKKWKSAYDISRDSGLSFMVCVGTGRITSKGTGAVGYFEKGPNMGGGPGSYDGLFGLQKKYPAKWINFYFAGASTYQNFLVANKFNMSVIDASKTLNSSRSSWPA